MGTHTPWSVGVRLHALGRRHFPLPLLSWGCPISHSAPPSLGITWALPLPEIFSAVEFLLALPPFLRLLHDLAGPGFRAHTWLCVHLGPFSCVRHHPHMTTHRPQPLGALAACRVLSSAKPEEQACPSGGLISTFAFPSSETQTSETPAPPVKSLIPCLYTHLPPGQPSPSPRGTPSMDWPPLGTSAEP